MSDIGVEIGAVPRSLRGDHRLVVENIELLGGNRVVRMSSGLNVVRGDITTGKTTFIRLIKAMLSTVPDSLIPEAASVRALQGVIELRSSTWQVYRPLVTTADAPVEIAQVDPDDPEPPAVRLNATGVEGSYSRFLLDQLGLPAVVIPEGTTSSTNRLNPVSISDWLGYCVVTGEELDFQVFGHRDPYRDRKRRVVFELIYGYYDTELSELNAERRGLELRITALDQEAEIIARFLSGTPFSNPMALAVELAMREEQLALVVAGQAALANQVSGLGADEIGEIRRTVLELRAKHDGVKADRVAIERQVVDLLELNRQLRSQSAKLTRAIVADEWLVDFDFLVCPRCGNDVHPSASTTDTCYLCHQPERPGNSQEVLLAEQRRVVSQMTETGDLIDLRRAALATFEDQLLEIDRALSAASRELNQRAESFVSDRASTLQSQAREQSRLQTEIEKLAEYGTLLNRREDRSAERAQLVQRTSEITQIIEARSTNVRRADENRHALESRFFEYLERLNIPLVADTLTVKINRTTYMPEVSGRSFDELSSQGLKTLVNAAHALAHHTVAVDRQLPLPGLLILDGLSANTGHEGFDQARVEDLYRLVMEVAEEYRESLQVVIVDNDLPASLANDLVPNTVLVLSQDDRLIRARAAEREVVEKTEAEAEATPPLESI